MEYEYISAALKAKPKQTLFEQAGLAPSALATLAVHEVDELAHSILRARMLANHPDRGGDAQKMKDLSHLNSLLTDPAAAHREYTNALPSARQFEEIVRRLAPEPEPTDWQGPAVLPQILNVLRFPVGRHSIDFDLLSDAEIVCLDVKVFDSLVNNFQHPEQKLVKQRYEEMKKRMEGGVEIPDLEARIEREIELAIDLPIFCERKFVKRALRQFFEKNKKAHEDVIAELKSRHPAESVEEVQALLIGEPAIYKAWREFAFKQSKKMTASERTEFRRSATVKYYENDIEEFEAQHREYEETEIARTYLDLPKEVEKEIIKLAAKTVHIKGGRIVGADAGEGERIFGVVCFAVAHRKEVEIFTHTRTLEEIRGKFVLGITDSEPPDLEEFLDADVESDNTIDGDESFRFERESITQREMTRAEVLEYASSESLRTREIYSREEITEAGRVLHFDLLEPFHYLVSIRPSSEGHYLIRELGVLKTIILPKNS